MGQKVNPHGLRVGVIKDWDSRWFAKKGQFGDTLVEDFNLRKHIKKQLYAAGVPKIEIERDPAKVRIHIHCARPGIVIGRGGQEIERLRKECEDMVNKNRENKLSVFINIIEVKSPDRNAQLVAESIASQLEHRTSFRRAMKQAIQRAMRLGVRGIKTNVSGRLGGAEIARSERYHEGTIPLQTLRADIDYGFAEANTTYGKIGVKVWIYAGEVLEDTKRQQPRQQFDKPAPRSDRPRTDNRGPRQGGGYNNQNRTGGGGYNNQNRTGGGGYNNQNRTGGGYNNPNRPAGGYNNQNRPATGVSNSPARDQSSAAPQASAPKEGGSK